jgi:uncharacterized protein (TIGR02246 family)
MFRLTSYRLLTQYGFFLLLAGTCVHCAEAPATTPDPTQDIRAQWDRFVLHWENEAADSLAAFYTEDGINVPPELAPNQGREEIQAFYDFLFNNNLSSEYEHRIESLAATGNQAVEYGTFTVDWVRNDSTTWTFQGRSLTHWTRTVDGDWQIAAFLFNTPPTEPAG